jgi:hypothetical protein
MFSNPVLPVQAPDIRQLAATAATCGVACVQNQHARTAGGSACGRWLVLRQWYIHAAADSLYTTSKLAPDEEAAGADCMRAAANDVKHHVNQHARNSTPVAVVGTFNSHHVMTVFDTQCTYLAGS